MSRGVVGRFSGLSRIGRRRGIGRGGLGGVSIGAVGWCFGVICSFKECWGDCFLCKYDDYVFELFLCSAECEGWGDSLETRS